MYIYIILLRVLGGPSFEFALLHWFPAWSARFSATGDGPETRTGPA